jgi:hypothetical protein
MALIKLGPLIGGISGNVSGLNFVASSTRPIVRKQRARVNVDHPTFTKNSARMQYLVNLWTTQTAATRAAWRTLAATVRYTDRIGQARQPTGRQFFLSHNLALMTAGLVPDTTVLPLAEAPFRWTASFLTTTGRTDVRWAVSFSGLPQDYYVSIFVQTFYRPTPQLAPATSGANISGAPNNWRWAQWTNLPGGTETQIWPAYEDVLGKFQPGQRLAVLAKWVRKGYFVTKSRTTSVIIP